MTIIDFPKKLEPWMRPQENFERDAREYVSDSPNAQHLVALLRSLASPFIRAAIIHCACTAVDDPFLPRIAERRDVSEPIPLPYADV
jgi:hypothetical protein